MTEQKKPEAIEDADLDEAQGAGAGVSPFVKRIEDPTVAEFHGSDFNAAMGNDGGRIHGSDFNAAMGNSGRGVKTSNNGEGW